MFEQSSPKKEFDRLWLKLFPVSDPESCYDGWEKGAYVLPKGMVITEGRMPLPCDILCQRDEEIVLRDGTRIYADIYHPADESAPVPAIMNWNPAGKQGRHDMTMPFLEDDERAFPKGAVSGLQVWLCNDPAPWVNDGYAVVSVDPRGVYNSEGDMYYFGETDAKDGVDAMEWIASQPWCSGNIGMAGNAYTAIEQWFMAEQNPPHLKAIAPWEGHADFYREEFAPGGVTKSGDPNMRRTFGSGRIEYIGGMIEKFPIYNEYWESKRVDPLKISIPAYVAASYNNNNHNRGTINMYRGLAAKEKWLRIHNTTETVFFRDEENRKDLKKFFDHYLKGMDNGWEKTPRVRMAVLDHGREDITDRPEGEYPLARQHLKKLFLAPGKKMTEKIPSASASVSYLSTDIEDSAEFIYEIDSNTEISGYMKLRLYAQTETAEDMDVFIRIDKLDADNNLMVQNYLAAHPRMSPIKYSGPFNGRLRASMRKTDPEKSTEQEPFYPFDEPMPLSPGEIVALDIGIPPTGLLFHNGEKLRLTITGFDAYGPGSGTGAIGTGKNKGRHIIHFGGEYDSHLLIPVIPQK